MKKQYISPFMETVKIKTAVHILAGSTDAPLGGTQSNDVALGRGFWDFGDDDEDEE